MCIDSNMVVDLKFSRFSEEPWGFRLTGGADFEFPLTVIKVHSTIYYTEHRVRSRSPIESKPCVRLFFFFIARKVTENSLAEEAGMKFGDIIVRINDTPASNLSHLEAHNVLLSAGNNFMVGVKR